MITHLSKKGRGYAVAVFTIGLGTIVEMTGTLALFWGILPPLQWAEVSVAYMLMMGGVATAFQGQNFARALPGLRPTGTQKANDEGG